MYVDPLRAEVHEKLGNLYLKSGQPEKALREFEIFLGMNPVDLATAHYRVAQALLEADRPEDARRHVLLALEIAPSYEEAQKLLLSLVRR